MFKNEHEYHGFGKGGWMLNTSDFFGM